VNGRPGYYVRMSLAQEGTYDVLAWEYAPHGWAVVSLWNDKAGRVVPVNAKRTSGHAPAGALKRLPDLAALQRDELRIAKAVQAASAADLKVPFSVSGLPGAWVSEIGTDGSGNGGVVIDTAGHDYDFGWSMFTLSPADKPATNTTTIAGREWILYHDRISGHLMSVGPVADGFGMTITSTNGERSLSDYETLISHLTFAPNLADHGHLVRRRHRAALEPRNRG
jgi:hypothetical protein